MDFQVVETTGKHLGIIAGIFTSIALIWKFVVGPIKQMLKRRRERDEAVTALKDSCILLKASIEGITCDITALKEARLAHDKADLNIRKSIYHGQVATISALREIASHLGLKINGPVELYYKQNIEALKTELGIEEDK